MEQQKTNTSPDSQATEHEIGHRSSVSHRESQPPTPSADPSSRTTERDPAHSTTDPSGSLANSEPSLRFPRPVGNCHLANWISSSDPDIMRIPTVRPDEEGSLADSAFEMIGAIDDEVLSQDENDHDLISESVSSLDARRTDDVHSLAGTEQMSDDEDYAQVNENTGSLIFHKEEYDDDREEHPVRGLPQPDPESIPDDEGDSTSSLEYTQQSLRAPSLSSQDGSEVLVSSPAAQDSISEAGDAPNEEIEDDAPKGRVHHWKHRLPDTLNDATIKRVLTVVPLYVLLAFGAVFLKNWVGGLQARTGLPSNDGVVPELATTVVSMDSTTSIISTSSHSTTALRPITTELGRGIGLIPMDQSPSDGWIFSSKQPEIVFKMASQNSVLAQFPSAVGDAWSLGDCIELTATRDGQPVDMSTTFVKEGVLSRFSRCETHGIVELALRSTCKPIVNKMVRVHFGPSMLEDVYERTKSIAQDLGELVPAAAQEAERRLSDARRSWTSLTYALSNSTLSASEQMVEGLRSLKGNLSSNLHELHHLGQLPLHIQQSVRERLSDLRGTSKQLGLDMKLSLLNAQLSSKIWWLRFTGHKAEGIDYQRKARRFMAEKRAAAAEIKNKLRESSHDAENWTSRLKQGLFRSKTQCLGGKQRPGWRGSHGCKAGSW